jgi:hypothetical protein
MNSDDAAQKSPVHAMARARSWCSRCYGSVAPIAPLTFLKAALIFAASGGITQQSHCSEEEVPRVSARRRVVLSSITGHMFDPAHFGRLQQGVRGARASTAPPTALLAPPGTALAVDQTGSTLHRWQVIATAARQGRELRHRVRDPASPQGSVWMKSCAKADTRCSALWRLGDCGCGAKSCRRWPRGRACRASMPRPMTKSSP